MSAIFISHSSADNDWAQRLATWLKGQGYESLFLDFDPEAGLEAGVKWREVIHRELRLSQAVIALCSEHFLTSQWCVSEVAIASGLCKHLFPLRIGPGELPKLLQDVQAIDFCADAEDGFRRLAQGLEQRLKWRDRLRWPSTRPPYPGLMACQEGDAAVFFGRDPECEEVLRRLRSLRQAGRAFLLVLGASGCGKSSLLRAGIVPQLRLDPASWLVLDPFRPRDEPFEELGDVLASAFQQLGQPPPEPPRTAEAWRHRLRELRQGSGQREASVVLPIDQFEELLVAAGSPLPGQGSAVADRFLHCLAEIVGSSDGRLLVIATLRSDFLGAIQLHPADLGRKTDQFLLGPMQQEGLLQVIEAPANRVGLKLEPGLALRMAEDTASGDALPLLAITLRELWETSAADGDLTLREYKSLGGLEKAVERAADAALPVGGLSETDRRALRNAFIPAMVRLSEQGVFTRRSARMADLPSAALPLLAQLANRRLLVQRGEGGERTVEVAHEALLRCWPLLRGWLEEDREFLKGYEQIKRDYFQWKETPQLDRTDLLLPRIKLAQAKAWLKDRPDAFEPQLKTYIEASEGHQRKSHLKARALAVGFSGLLLLALFASLRLSPLLQARLLTPLALLTRNDGLIRQALVALHAHRQSLLEVEPSPADPATPRGVQALHCEAHRSHPFCVSERQVMQLLELNQAPYSLQALQEKLASNQLGDRAPGLSLKPIASRFTEGALKHTALLLFDRKGAGADLYDNDGLLTSSKEAWMMPCDLLLVIKRLWESAGFQSRGPAKRPICHLFPNDLSQGDYGDSACEGIDNSMEGPTRIEKKALSYWLFDPAQDEPYRRYTFCLAQTGKS